MSALVTNLSFLWKLRGAAAAPDVDMRHPLRSARDLFRSKWWSIGCATAAVAFALHVAALTLAPLSIGQAVLAGGLVFLAVLAERYFGFELGQRQWAGIVVVALALGLLTLTGGVGREPNSGYSVVGMILFEGIAIGVGVLLVVSHAIERIPIQRGLMLGVAAGLGFGISDVAIKALSGDLDRGPLALLSPWSAVIVVAAVGSFFASARSLQVGDGVALIAVTSVAVLILAGTALIANRAAEQRPFPLESGLDGAPMSPRDTKHLRVLIANERKDRLALVAPIVAALGHEVIAREIGVADVGAVTARERPDVALVGLGESSEHALELIDRIVREAACPVIVLLHARDPDFVTEASKRGVFAHISDADVEDWQSSIDIVLRRFAEYHDLEGAFGRRALTERAKGILMERHSIDEAAAFEMLRHQARVGNRKLIDLAAAVVDGHRLLPKQPASEQD